jgi:hypothetical protein
MASSVPPAAGDARAGDPPDPFPFYRRFDPGRDLEVDRWIDKS